MKVLHVIQSIAQSTGGPARSSQGLVAALNRIGVKAWLFSFTPGESQWIEGVTRFKAVTSNRQTEERTHEEVNKDSRRRLRALCTFWKKQKEFEAFVEDIKPDLIHVHAIWCFGSHIACKVARKKGIPYIVAPRGMLEPWSLQQKKWKKLLAMCFYQRRDLKGSCLLHATAESEALQFRNLRLFQPIVISPNGVNFPQKLPERNLHADGRRRMLFVSRIHPKKGLLDLIEAWSRILPEQWVLEIVGTDADGYQRSVEDKVRKLCLCNSVIFTGPLDDTKKWEAYRRADVFVLPTYSENFGIVVAEALYAHVPVITTKGTPWEELSSEHCGWWIDIGVEPLVQVLQDAMALTDSERHQMGMNGRTLVEKKYTWSAVAMQMKLAYDWLLTHDAKPTGDVLLHLSQEGITYGEHS